MPTKNIFEVKAGVEILILVGNPLMSRLEHKTRCLPYDINGIATEEYITMLTRVINVIDEGSHISSIYQHNPS